MVASVHHRVDWKLVHKFVCTASKSRQLTPPLSPADQEAKRAAWRLRECAHFSCVYVGKYQSCMVARYELAIEDEPPETALSEVTCRTAPRHTL